MVRLSKSCYKENGVPVISSTDIETFVNRQLKDYDKHFFDAPHAIDIDDFIENYLKINPQYYTLSLDGSVLGKTALTKGSMPIIDSDGKIKLRLAPKGMLCIDLDACGNEHRIRFTLAHEAGHAVFHLNVNKEVLSKKNCIKDTYITVDKFGSVVYVERKTDLDWMEFQANVYARCLLMPRLNVKKVYKQKHDDYFMNKRITSSRPNRLWKIVIEMSDLFNVSRQAMAIRLKQLKLISNEQYNSLQLNKRKESEL